MSVKNRVWGLIQAKKLFTLIAIVFTGYFLLNNAIDYNEVTLRRVELEKTHNNGSISRISKANSISKPRVTAVKKERSVDNERFNENILLYNRIPKTGSNTISAIFKYMSRSKRFMFLKGQRYPRHMTEGGQKRFTVLTYRVFH